MNIGFICEGKTEKKIIESRFFQDLLSSFNLQCPREQIIDAKGKDKLLPKSLDGYIARLQLHKVERIIILTDLDEDRCITLTKKRIIGENKSELLIIVAVKVIEAWFLADSGCMSKILKQNFEHSAPETLKNPFEEIGNLMREKTGRGAGVKPLLAGMMLRNGFSVLRAAAHPNCASAKYFIEKLKALNESAIG